VVEGARLESESGDAHEVILKHLFAQSIQRVPATECASMWTHKGRCLSRVPGRPYTVSTQFWAALVRVRRDACGYVSIGRPSNLQPPLTRVIVRNSYPWWIALFFSVVVTFVTPVTDSRSRSQTTITVQRLDFTCVAGSRRNLDKNARGTLFAL